LKEARLAAYAAKKAKSKFPEIGIYSFFLLLFLLFSCVTEWHITKAEFAKNSQEVVLSFEDVTQFEYLAMALKIRKGICNAVTEK
jgi:hypothetical protein